VPDLALAAELRASPELHGHPVAIASGSEGRAEVVAASPEALREGVRRLTSIAHARAACSRLCVRVASPALERAARETLLDAGLSCSPRAELAPLQAGIFGAEACVFVDASGVETLFRSEAGFATALASRAEGLGLAGCVAVAGSRTPARIAARRLEPGEVRVIPPGQEQAFLAALPLELLDPDDAVLESLTRFGVRSVRELLALPARALGTRLGPGALALIEQARGRQKEAPLPEAAPSRLVEAVDLEHEIDRLEPLVFVLQGLLSRLLARLEARQLACSGLALRLELEGRARAARRVGLAAPTLDLRVLVRLLAQALESQPPGAAVLGAALEAEGRALVASQLDLFRPDGPAPASLGTTLAELQALCGADRIGSPHPPDDHRPHLFELRPFSPPSAGNARSGAKPGEVTKAETARPGASTRPPRPPLEAGSPAPPSLSTRALRPPIPAEVRLQGTGPGWIRSTVASGKVLHLAGPWRTTGGWWAPESRYAYDYFDVLTSDGTLSRLRFDHLGRAWHVDAVYD
jgi:protein ImuB